MIPNCFLIPWSKTFWYHRQRRQAPRTPHRRVVVGLLQRTQVTKRPRHLKSVAFHISVVARCRPDNTGDVACHTGFLCYTYNHTRCKGSANRAKYQRKTSFSLYFRGAVYLIQRIKVRISERKTKLIWIFPSGSRVRLTSTKIKPKKLWLGFRINRIPRSVLFNCILQIVSKCL